MNQSLPLLATQIPTLWKIHRGGGGGGGGGIADLFQDQWPLEFGGQMEQRGALRGKAHSGQAEEAASGSSLT